MTGRLSRLAIASLLLAGSALAAERVKAEAERGTDLSRYTTFSWKEPLDPGGKPSRSDLWRQRFRAAVERQLAGRGLHRVDGAGASLVIEDSFSLRPETASITNRAAPGGGGGPTQYAREGASYDDLTYKLEMSDGASGKRVWKARLTDEVTADMSARMEALVQHEAAALLKEYPGATR